MRKEFKLGAFIFVIFTVVRFIAEDKLSEMPLIHFLLGILAGVAIILIMIGALPEAKYLRIKAFKKKLNPFVK